MAIRGKDRDPLIQRADEFRPQVETDDDVIGELRRKVVLQTTLGSITVQMEPEWAPNHVRNFLMLATTGWYDGTSFHRVSRGFVVQGGDPYSKGGEHAKGPVAMSVVSKQGGREFHGSVFGYFRDYHLNSNEWFANKVGADRVKNKFIYPGFSVSGPLLIPGTDFNKNRDKVFFFAGFEYFGQKLDTGYVKSWVPTQGMRSGNFNDAPSVGTGSYVNRVPNLPGGIVPGNLVDPGGQVGVVGHVDAELDALLLGHLPDLLGGELFGTELGHVHVQLDEVYLQLRRQGDRVLEIWHLD